MAAASSAVVTTAAVAIGLCSFGGPLLPRTLSATIPTIAVEPTNSGFFSFIGSFTSAGKLSSLSHYYASWQDLAGVAGTCSFPTKSGAGFAAATNTIQPFYAFAGANGLRTTKNCAPLVPAATNAAAGSTTYTAISCPSLIYNGVGSALHTTYTLGFSEGTGPAFAPQTFALTTPLTSTVLATATVTSAVANTPAVTGYVCLHTK